MAFGRVPAYCKYELFMERYRSAAEFIDAPPPGGLHGHRLILDVGCGTGLMKQFSDDPRLEWHGVDIDEERLGQCSELEYRVSKINLDIQPLVCQDQQFDIVVASHVLEHLAEPTKILRELDRVLCPNGILILAVPIKPPPFHIPLGMLRRRKRMRTGHTSQVFSLSSFRTMVRRALAGKYDEIDVRGFRFLSARRRFGWENRHWFYAANVWIGRHAPLICREINLVLRKRSG